MVPGRVGDGVLAALLWNKSKPQAARRASVCAGARVEGLPSYVRDNGAFAALGQLFERIKAPSGRMPRRWKLPPKFEVPPTRPRLAARRTRAETDLRDDGKNPQPLVL